MLEWLKSKLRIGKKGRADAHNQRVIAGHMDHMDERPPPEIKSDRRQNPHRRLLPGLKWCSSFEARVIMPLMGYGRGRLFGTHIPRVKHRRPMGNPPLWQMRP